MKKNSLIILFLSFTLVGFSQEIDSQKMEREARENLREGNVLYNQLKFSEAEVAYKKALSKTPNYPKASYNLGNAIYQQNRNKEAVAQFEILEKTAPDKMSKAEAYHNMGNSFMKEKQYDKAVASFKNSMRNNDKDEETRYNLALAQELLEQQNQDNKDNKDKNENKDDKNKDQKDKEGGDDEKKEDKNDEKDKGKDKENDKSDQKKDQDKKDQKPRPNQLTPEQMKQLLEAMNNEENKTQKKLNAEKTKGKKIKQEKDW